MTNPALLGQLTDLHEMQRDLLATREAMLCDHRPSPRLASLNWYYGRGVYLELLWLRENLNRDDDLSQRVRHLFTEGALPLDEQCRQLPDRDHLIHWATEIRDEHIRLLATPGALPAEHPWLQDDRLAWYLLQEQAKLYENMLLVLYQSRLQEPDDGRYRCTEPLEPVPPAWETRELSQGHYRIGARDEPRAYDNELPPQAVELSSYRIALTPVSNAQYLEFMRQEGYRDETLWNEAGRSWLNEQRRDHPEYWRRDSQGNWYEIALNGATPLPPEEAVTGVSLHEAQAFAAWAGRQSELTEGAILQHEYQWEMAARSGVLTRSGRSWEWCGNPLHPYPQFEPFPDNTVSQEAFQRALHTLKGGSLHTPKVLRRASFRHWAEPDDRHHLAGIRLVFPPRHSWT
ncbi:MAG: SUMF1/EgtB/PvdO family nonheme iron enzyme [Candidatus Thiodiazotropha sp.]